MEKEVLKAIEDFNIALSLLDDYDHQCVTKPVGNKTIYRLEYQECRDLIDSMIFKETSSVFGVEKEVGKLNGIIAAIYQSAFGEDVYLSIEEKASNFLYFLITDHPFVDGCKRIGASLFLLFLYKNNILIRDNEYVLSNSALVAITLLVAESKPEEKDIMINLIMNFLKVGK